MLRKIQRFREVQHCYMPTLAQNLNGGLNDVTATPETIPLYLPSAFPQDTRASLCLAGIATIEDELRFAKGKELLSELRSQLLKRTLGNKYKAKQPPSQRAFTRFKILQDQTEAKIKLAVSLYTITRNALLTLRGAGEWETMLRTLKSEDIRGMHDKAAAAEEAEDYRITRNLAGLPEGPVRGESDIMEAIPTVSHHPVISVGERKRTLSWIWYTASKDEIGESQLNEGESFHSISAPSNYAHIAAYRIQWLKSRANAARFREELMLLEEEMRRTIHFCHWKRDWWLERRTSRQVDSPSLAAGLHAYAEQQADIEQLRASQLTHRWGPVRERAKNVRKHQMDGSNTDSTFSWSELIIEIEDDGYEDDEAYEYETAESLI